MEERIHRWEKSGPFTTLAFLKLCEELVSSKERDEWQLTDSLKKKYWFFSSKEMKKLKELEKTKPCISKALDGDSVASCCIVKCIICRERFAKGKSGRGYGYCYTCCETKKEVCCESHLSGCDNCLRQACDMCGNVELCRYCLSNYCMDCMAGEGSGVYCQRCNNGYYCSECLKDGLCHHCDDSSSGEQVK